MNKGRKFTYPFCYTPAPEVVAASEKIISRIGGSEELGKLFSEGKMLGVLMVEDGAGKVDFLYGFSGLAGGRSVVEGFVPPILDLQIPGCHFKEKEAEISALNREIAQCADPARARELKTERRSLSNDLQEWLFRNYIVNNAKGESESIWDIFAAKGLVPPAGTGECAAPKLLQYAYLHGLRPLAMGEFWYGDSPRNEVRHQGRFYPSCTGKCGPLLSFMLQGLDVEPNPLEEDPQELEKVVIVYEDDDIIVADKPSGMLAVPGRTLKVSLQERLTAREGNTAVICSCHRLDMDTSGLMVFAKGAENQAVLQQQFEKRQTAKTYIARLAAAGELPPLPASGRIILPLSCDYYDRPRQMVDFENGKQAVTDWELISVLPDGTAYVKFHPLTGRTHQLRVHAAHPLGLGRPILGDRLYGGGSGRLCLHSAVLEFYHPKTGAKMHFESEPGF